MNHSFGPVSRRIGLLSPRPAQSYIYRRALQSPTLRSTSLRHLPRPTFLSFCITQAEQRRLASNTSGHISPASPSASTNSTPPPAQPRRISTLRLVLLSAFFLTAGFVMAAAPIIPTATGLITPPSDLETLKMFTPDTESAEKINNYILSHPLSEKYRADPLFTEARPHMKIPPAMRAHNLTGGTLLGTDKIEVPPLMFQDVKAELPSLVSIVHLGPALCGHPGIVHGGLLATLLDEGLARACFPALPNKVGVTASLKVDYRKPCPANSYVVLRAETTKVEGRKAWVKGWIELLGEGTEEGVKVVEAEALFIEPKGAASMPKIHSPS